MQNKQIKYGKWLLNVLGNTVQYLILTKTIIVIKIKKKNLKLSILVLKLHQNCLFCSLIDLCVTDFLFKKKRFSVLYNILSVVYNKRIFIKINTEVNKKIDSISNFFKSANWLEREAFDLFGIFFVNHKDLRRLLSDYGFEGHAIRKDFPLSGFTELLYDTSTKKIVCKPVQFSQNFRFFFFSQWSALLNKTNIKKQG